MGGAFGVARGPMMETATLPAAQDSRARRGSFWTIVSVMVLVGAEVFGVALAAGWAIAGLLELGDVVSYILMGLFSLLGLYVMILLWRRAMKVEPIGRRR
jgi:uncharacterized membrane protein YhaH (DUF805 family)